MRKLALVAGLASLFAFAQQDTSDARLKNAAEAFEDIMKTPDKAIPQKLLDRAECVIIVPGMKKGALGVGGSYGRGFASCRTATGHWGPPAGIRLAGGSFGFQLGVQSTDVLMLVMNKSGLNHLLSDKFTIGAEGGAALGPVGRDMTADTDALMLAEIISWSRSRGVFAGVSLDGTVVSGDKAESESLYGKPLSTKEIILGRVTPSAGARPLLATLEKYAPPATTKGENVKRQLAAPEPVPLRTRW